MSTKKIGVGIIGANPEQGWALSAHIPALRTLSDKFEFKALSTTRKETADAASKKFNVDLAFDNHQSLVERPEVNLVSVSVKVPYHLELASAAIQAGKAVYCEWPLGNGLEEAEKLAAMVKDRGVYAAVGLQARSSPVIRYVRDLIADGFVGEVLSSSIVASGFPWGAETHQPYLLDRKNGASMLTIPFGHTVDAFCWTLGEFKELSATLATRRPQVRVTGTDKILPSTVADQVAVTGILESGAVVSIHFRGGNCRGTNFLWEINGTEGDLVITSNSGHTQLSPLHLKGAKGKDTEVVDMPVPESYLLPVGPLEEGPAANVTRAYESLASDINSGKQTLPSFDDAVIRHRMIEAIVTASKTGQRQSYVTTK